MNNFLLGSIARAVTASAFVTVSCVAIAETTTVTGGLPITVNGKSCGSYTDVAFNAQGHLVLKGDFTCGTTTGQTDNSDNSDNSGNSGNSGNPTPSVCGTPPENGWRTVDHQWNLNIAANARAPLRLMGLETYSVKLINEKSVEGQDISKGKGGYGTIKTYDLPGDIGVRTLVISECPNSMIPTGQDTFPGYNPCISTASASTSIAWSHQLNNKILTQCSLDPNKQYYVNVKHVSAPKEELTCKTGSCVFLFDYSFGKFLK